MKYSKAQQRAIDDAKRDIDTARAYNTFEEWEGETNSFCRARGGADYVRENIERFECYREYYERYRAGDVLTNAGKNTIEALVRMGVFSVEEYSNYRNGGCVLDWVHLNNY